MPGRSCASSPTALSARLFCSATCEVRADRPKRGHPPATDTPEAAATGPDRAKRRAPACRRTHAVPFSGSLATDDRALAEIYRARAAASCLARRRAATHCRSLGRGGSAVGPGWALADRKSTSLNFTHFATAYGL